MHIIYEKICWSSKFSCHVLANNKNWPIVSMAAMRYIGRSHLVSTYIQHAAISVASFIKIALRLRETSLRCNRLSYWCRLGIYVYIICAILYGVENFSLGTLQTRDRSKYILCKGINIFKLKNVLYRFYNKHDDQNS